MNNALSERIDERIRQKHYRLVNSVVVYQNEELLVERYYNRCHEDSRHNIKSIWKSILSICVGICLDRGYIQSLDEPIANYLDVFRQHIHPYHKLITVRNLLTMTSGIYWSGGVHYHCPMLEQLWRSRNWVAYLAEVAMADVPGTKYVYKEWDVILLSAVIGTVCGMNAYDFCEKHLYRPLAIQSGKWGKSPCGISYTIIPGQEASSDLSAKDLAKIGNLFLHKGNYDGEGIVSHEYVQQAVTSSLSDMHYGFLWWIFDDFFGCRGFGGQEINVFPEQKAVAVIQAKATSRSKSYGDLFTEVIKDLLMNTAER